MLLENEILIARARNVSGIPRDLAINASLTGPMIRSCGVPYDVRKADPYSVYERFDFAIPFGENGDSYDRFLVRMAEMRESVKIVKQAVKGLPGGPFKVDTPL